MRMGEKETRGRGVREGEKEWRERGVTWVGYGYREWVEREMMSKRIEGFEKNKK